MSDADDDHAGNADHDGDLELTAVLTALAGVRAGQTVALLGVAPRLAGALAAGCGRSLVAQPPADVVVALATYDVPRAVSLLGDGGRLVALAADPGAAGRTADRHGLRLHHVESLADRVAWSAVRGRAD